jgi:hypothetical protein
MTSRDWRFLEVVWGVTPRGVVGLLVAVVSEELQLEWSSGM